MSRKLSYVLIAVVAFTLAGGSFAYAQYRGCLFPEGIPGITLDDGQKTKIQTLDAKHQKNMIRLHAEHRIARIDLETILENRDFKKNQAESQVKKIMGIETEMELNRIERIHDLKGVLTADQWNAYINSTGGERGGCRSGAAGRGYGMHGDRKSMGPHHKGMRGGGMRGHMWNSPTPENAR